VIAGEIAAVIALWFVALHIWNLPTLLAALRTLRGVFRFTCGGVFALAALALLAFGLPEVARDAFSSIAIVTFLTGLGVEIIVGDDLRGALLRKR
jgi:hypothetical protein